MKVGEFFESDKIFKEDVFAIADESSYWQSASNFICENWDRDMEKLTDRQARWASKIQEDMVERRIKGKS